MTDAFFVLFCFAHFEARLKCLEISAHWAAACVRQLSHFKISLIKKLRLSNMVIQMVTVINLGAHNY